MSSLSATRCAWVQVHGLAEYIAQEEMERRNGFWWSNDSSLIAFTEVSPRFWALGLLSGLEVSYGSPHLGPASCFTKESTAYFCGAQLPQGLRRGQAWALGQ